MRWYELLDETTSHVISKNWRFILINTFVQIIIFSVRNICEFIINNDNNIYACNTRIIIRSSSEPAIHLLKFPQNSHKIPKFILWQFLQNSHKIHIIVCGEKFQKIHTTCVVKNSNIIFRKWGGGLGVKGPLEFFRKSVRPSVLFNFFCNKTMFRYAKNDR